MNALINNYPKLELFCFSGESFLDKNYLIEEVTNPNLLSSEAYKRNIQLLFETGEEAFNLLTDRNSFFPGPPLYIFKRSILKNNEIKFSQIRFEDEEFTPKLFIYAGLTYSTKKIFFKRRVRPGSTMQINRNFKDIFGYFSVIESLASIQIKKNSEIFYFNKS